MDWSEALTGSGETVGYWGHVPPRVCPPMVDSHLSTRSYSSWFIICMWMKAMQTSIRKAAFIKKQRGGLEYSRAGLLLTGAGGNQGLKQTQEYISVSALFISVFLQSSFLCFCGSSDGKKTSFQELLSLNVTTVTPHKDLSLWGSLLPPTFSPSRSFSLQF